MTVDRLTLGAIGAEARDAAAIQPYQAVNGLSVCLVKLANLLPTVGGRARANCVTPQAIHS